MNKKYISKKIQKNQQRNFIQLHISFELEIYPYIVGFPPFRVDTLMLCSRSVPYCIVVINYILSYNNSTESKKI